MGDDQRKRVLKLKGFLWSERNTEKLLSQGFSEKEIEELFFSPAARWFREKPERLSVLSPQGDVVILIVVQIVFDEWVYAHGARDANEEEVAKYWRIRLRTPQIGDMG